MATSRPGLLSSFAAFCMMASAQQVEFNRDIRPILSDRCFTCHGPDASNRKAGLRFDLEGGAKAVGNQIVRRIGSEDPAVRMPPVYSGRARLSAHEIELMRAWIAEGAPW